MTSRLRSKLRIYRLPILAGFFIGTSYIPFQPWALFFCLVPLFLFWKNATSAKSAFAGGWITQFILNILGFSWIAHTAIEFGHFPVWAGVLVLVGFAAIAHLYYAVGGALGVWLCRRLQIDSRFAIPVFAATFAICDLEFAKIFPWHLGYPWLWAHFPGAQFADVIGFEGLNVFTIMINALIAMGIDQGWRNKGRWAIGSALAIVFTLNVLGLGRAERWRQTDAEVPILAVQGNIGNFDKLLVEKGQQFRIPVVNKYIDLSRRGLLEHPDAALVLWPETAFPDVLDIPFQNEELASRIREFTRANHVGLLTGSYSYDQATKATFNGFFSMNDTGFTPSPPYRKSILLVFGETFPFSEYLPYMDKLFPNQGSFGRGSGPFLIPVSYSGRTVIIGPQICYEGLYPWFTVSLANQGAELLVNVTNDSWFGRDFEPYQHLFMTLARAIEVRRPLIRATNTGITTAITASGDLMTFSPQEKEWTGLFKVPYKVNPPHTVFEQVERLWRWILILSLMGLLVIGRRKLKLDAR